MFANVCLCSLFVHFCSLFMLQKLTQFIFAFVRLEFSMFALELLYAFDRSLELDEWQMVATLANICIMQSNFRLLLFAWELLCFGFQLSV